MLDLLIRGGRVVDGTGNPWFWADVGVQGDRIVAIERNLAADACSVIDAAGQVVAPGFVDMHTHSEYTILAHPENEAKIRQGITTECIGQVVSPGPLRGTAIDEARSLLSALDLRLDWNSLAGYFDRLDRAGIAQNICSYVSYATIRKGVLGDTDRRPTSDELEGMKDLLLRGMEQGALGLVANLYNSDAIYATTDELVELAGLAGRCGGIFCVGLRDEATGVLEALGEAIEIGRRARVPVEILHMKLAGRDSWGRSEQYVDMIERARAEGVDVTGNQYPYTAADLPLFAVLPHWVRAGGMQHVARRLGEPEVRSRLRREFGEPWAGQFNWVRSAGGWSGVVLEDVPPGGDERHVGRSLHEVAESAGQDPADIALDVIVAGIGSDTVPRMIVHAMSEDDVATLVRRPWAGVCSDSGGEPGQGKRHPRVYGTFPTVLGEYSRDRGLFSLEEGVRKATYHAARRLGLRERGMVQRGWYADLVVFDPDTIRPESTYERPDRFPTGIDWVVVNGQAVVDPDGVNGARPGRALRRAC